MTGPVEGDLDVVNGYLVAFVDECTCDTPDERLYGHRDQCGYEPLVNLAGMPPAQRAAVAIDTTAALGTPEVVFRRSPQESMREAGDRLHSEVMVTARGALVAALDTTELAKVIAGHQMTRHSTTDHPSGYRVWLTCRCQWASPDVEDPNVPNVEAAKALHVAQAIKAHVVGAR